MSKETPKQGAERRALYREFLSSGKTAAEFARKRGISHWRVKAAIRKTETERQSAGEFREVTLPVLAGVSYTVTLRNGRELLIPLQFSEERVRQLVGLLESC